MTGRRVGAGLLGLALLGLAGCSTTDDGPDPEESGTPSSAAPGRTGTPDPDEDADEDGEGRTDPSGTADPSESADSHGPGTNRPASRRWRPRPGTRWQWQLDGRVDMSVDVPVYDIDGFENSAKTVAGLHARGRKVICYINAGAWEKFRPDQADFPKELLGENNGWAGERWLDIRRLDVLEPLMAARIEMCRKKGFDAVEPDLTEGYRNTTGFPLTAAHQLDFNRMLAKLAHDRGLAVGLKNDLDQIPELVGDFDFAVNEECAQFGECDRLAPFVRRDKAVFHVEYALAPDAFCRDAKRLGLSSMRKRLDLDSWRKPC
ncbi:endo alpha-1,4 polygalactosaminidase [Streptomyces syringium]|uniref:endo alpha-1,4 polygalactosaminidase n=1 Tax=Streptomyces syringium TaxID=76729 RepID=UPI0033D5FD40